MDAFIWIYVAFFAVVVIWVQEHKITIETMRRAYTAKAPHAAIAKWTKKYGGVYGYYEGGIPVTVVSDVEIVREILIRQFPNFHSRKRFPLQPNPDTHKDAHLFTSRGKRWKRLRAIANPAFTAVKMRKMAGTINGCLNDTMRVIEQRSNEKKPFDAWLLYQGLTLDTIARCCYGLQTNCQTNQNDDFLLLCRKVFQKNAGPFPIFSNLASLVPELRFLWTPMAYITARFRGVPMFLLEDRLRAVVKQRKQEQETNKGRNDLIQIMLDSELSEKEATAVIDDSAKTELELKDLSFARRLTIEEIVQQAILFMLAGYETSSTTLTYATYLLATNQKEQAKLQMEIDAHFGSDKEEINYDSVSKLPYLEKVINETIRLYPVGGMVVNRECMVPTTINGIPFPKSMNVQIDVYSLHRNQDIWGSDADKFNPDRFEAEIPQGAFLPFGGGPRFCIGMRFALMEIKMTLVRILRDYSFRQCAETQVPLKLNSYLTVYPASEVMVTVETRTKPKVL